MWWSLELMFTLRKYYSKQKHHNEGVGLVSNNKTIHHKVMSVRYFDLLSTNFFGLLCQL